MSPQDRIAQFAPNWNFNVHRCIATDFAINFAAIEGDPALKSKLIAVSLEATAAAYRALAEGAAQAAKIAAGGKQ